MSLNSTCITRSLKGIVSAALSIGILSAGAASAQTATTTPASVALTLTPSAVASGTHPPVRITFPPLQAGTPRDLTTATVTIGNMQVKALGAPPDANTLVVDPPALDISGDADVRVTSGGTELGRGTLRYGAVAHVEMPNARLLFLYVAILVVFVFLTVWEDIRRGYNALNLARGQLMEKISPGVLTDGQLTTLTAQLQQAPPGIEGLSRTTIAFTLLLIIGIALFHIVVSAEISGTDIPPVVEHILTLLAGALTSITGFYFGSRAAQTASDDSTRPATPQAASQSGPSAPSVTPAQAKPNEDIIITGAGFGQDVGTVTFGPIPADVSRMAWSDTRIKVVVPAGARPGPAPITITRSDRHQIAIASTAFTVLPA